MGGSSRLYRHRMVEQIWRLVEALRSLDGYHWCHGKLQGLPVLEAREVSLWPKLQVQALMAESAASSDLPNVMLLYKTAASTACLFQDFQCITSAHFWSTVQSRLVLLHRIVQIYSFTEVHQVILV